MAKGFIGASGCKAYLGAVKMRKGYIGATRVYSVGNIVTYHVDTGVTYQEEVDEGESCLLPKTFTPSKSGWEFKGWRQDVSPYSDTLTSLVMGDEPITLYAVFVKDVTVTYYNGSITASSTSQYRRYNNGNIINPIFTLTQSGLSGWTARGWSTSTAGNGGISYNNGATFTRDSNITLYGMYQQTITVTYYNNSTTAATTSGTRYYNSNENVVNPSFKLTLAARNGWYAVGWSTGTAGDSAIAYYTGTSFERDSDSTLYGIYYQSITMTYYNGSTTAAEIIGGRYYNSGSGDVVNPRFKLTPATLSGWTFRGWATSSAATAGIAYSSISNTVFTSNTTVYAAYSQTITLSYSGNGSTGGSTAAQTGTRYWNTGNVSNPSFTLSANGFAKSGYTFSKWALGSTSGTQYAAGASVTLSANTTMYALWKAGSIVVTGNSSYISPSSTSMGAGVWYRNSYEENTDIVTVNYAGYNKVTIEFYYMINNAGGTDKPIELKINGVTVVSNKIDYGQKISLGTYVSSNGTISTYKYTATYTEITQIKIETYVGNFYGQTNNTWADMRVSINSAVLSM